MSGQLDQVKEWAIQEFQKLMPGGIISDDELSLMFKNLLTQDAAHIESELSNLLDFSLKECKKFIKELVERVKQARAYAQKVKQVQAQTNQKNKEMGGGTSKSTKVVRGDLSKYLVPGRKICYCQATIHKLISNCISCGKVVCEQEGEGPCLFCGAWVDREQMYDVDAEDQAFYETALEHRDRLIDFDVNAQKRLGVLDERSDWYELANNTWLNKDQRSFATEQLAIQKKKEAEVADQNILTLNLGTGEAEIVKDSTDIGDFSVMNEAANEYMADQAQHGALKKAAPGAKYKPFEVEGNFTDSICNQEDMVKAANQFTFKACTLSDEKTQALYDGMSSNAKGAKKKVVAGSIPQSSAAPHHDLMQTGLSQRLQTENPFEEFRLAVERAVMEKSRAPKKVFQGDQAFYREADDQGMCLSMHQPWASLLVHGFKRFEGREWSNKFRGPLWIHATQKKPSQQEVDDLEARYTQFYKSIGEDLPSFPERYLTGSVVGKVDLIDVISYGEYSDTIPRKLQEPTEASFLFVVRNPQYLDIPLKLSGSPGLYKLPKEILYGARDKLKKAPYTWWPPEEYKGHTMGRFDLYPEDYSNWTRDQIISHIEKNQVKKQPDPRRLSFGCFHLKHFLDASGQQGFIDAIREMCLDNPAKMRFQRSEKLTKEFHEESDSFEAANAKTQEMAARNLKKFGCYVLDINHKDMQENLHELKMLSLSIEEGANDAVKKSQEEGSEYSNNAQSNGQNSRANYQKYIFDFLKERNEDEEDAGGYTEMIDLPNIGKSHGSKKNKLQLNYWAIAFGATIQIDYRVLEEGEPLQTLSVTLESGDAFVTNSLVKSISYRVRETTPKYTQKLVMREGCLLLSAERD